MKRAAILLIAAAAILTTATQGHARIKLVALPQRAATIVRLDNPAATLIEEERVLTLQAGVNQVDFSWKAVAIDEDSIRLAVLDNPDAVRLLSVSYPPGEQALVWQIAADEPIQQQVRISYLLANIDRLVTYKLVADKNETQVDLKSFIVLRNFSGEDFDDARVMLDYGEGFDRSIRHEETKQLLFLSKDSLPIRKVWNWDSQQQPWDPEQVEGNIGIPVHYEIANTSDTGLGAHGLWGGKVRVYQNDGHGSTIFLGEDHAPLTPVGEKMEVYIGDSRDIVVTQRKMREQQVNVRRDQRGDIILYDLDIVVNAKVENFKDSRAALTMRQNLDGEWQMVECNHEYEIENANTLKFEVELPARDGEKPATEELEMHYRQVNIRPR